METSTAAYSVEVPTSRAWHSGVTTILGESKKEIPDDTVLALSDMSKLDDDMRDVGGVEVCPKHLSAVVEPELYR